MLIWRPILHRGMASLSSSIQQQKEVLRKVIKTKLRKFSLQDQQREESAIQAHILSAEWFKQSKALCAYLRCDVLKEVDTSQVVGEVLKGRDSVLLKPRHLYVPRVMDREANMVMLNISTLADLTTNSMGIREPELKDVEGNPRRNVMDGEMPIELLLLPGLGFDHRGHRLGRGGGYYDVFLQKYLSLVREKGWSRPLLVALAYSVQIVDDEVPTDDTDIPVDVLVLSSGIVPVSEYGIKMMNSLTNN